MRRTLVGDEGCHDANGGVAGGQIGYRWQSAAWVFGLEAQGDWADLQRLERQPALPRLHAIVQIDAFGLFTGQIGYAWNNVLLYVKGGAAVTDDRLPTSSRPAPASCSPAPPDETRWGGTVGAGLEYGFAPNWSAGVEYDHLFMGNRNVHVHGIRRWPAPCTDSIRQDVDLVTVRVNYRWGGPVVAKY